jgi:hypothetical protein
VDLGVADPGVVIDHGVHERVTHLGVVEGVLGFPGGRGPVPGAGGAADEAPPATVGDVAQLLDVDVDQRARVGMLVPAHRLPGGPVEVSEPVQPAPGQHPGHRGGRHADQRGELDRAEAFAQPQRHDPLSRAPVSLGRARPGRLDRSVTGSPAAYRRAHRRTVVDEHWNRAATSLIGTFWSITSLATINRWRGVKAALAWDTRASCA